MELIASKVEKLVNSEGMKSQNHDYKEEQHFDNKQLKELNFENIRKVEESRQGKNSQEPMVLCTQQEELLNMIDELKKDISSEKLKLSSIETMIRTFHSDNLDMKNSQNSDVERRVCVLKEDIKNVAKESKGLRSLIDNQKHDKQEVLTVKELNTYSEIVSKTESHEVKLKKLEKSINEVKNICAPVNPRYDGQIKTEQMEFISKKIEEQKKTLEIFFEKIEEKFK